MISTDFARSLDMIASTSLPTDEGRYSPSQVVQSDREEHDIGVARNGLIETPQHSIGSVAPFAGIEHGHAMALRAQGRLELLGVTLRRRTGLRGEVAMPERDELDLGLRGSRPANRQQASESDRHDPNVHAVPTHSQLPEHQRGLSPASVMRCMTRRKP